MTKTYFIADLHLSEAQPHLTALFHHFLEVILQPGDQLYILGDLFEFWIGDDHLSLYQQNLQKTLAKLTVKRISWYFLAGNRDFLVSKKFIVNAGGHYLVEPQMIVCHHKLLLLIHGDTLCIHDHAYQRFRAWVHQAWLQRLFSLLPWQWRMKVAEKMRAESRNAKPYDPRIMDAAPEAVEHLFVHYPVEAIIHGHTHRPSIDCYYQQRPCMRIVLADWHEQGNYCVLDESGVFRLEYFS